MEQFISENFKHILYFLGTALASFVTWWATRWRERRKDKEQNDASIRRDFESLSKANTDFRNEIRSDLKRTREELEVAKKQIAVLEADLQKKIDEILVLRSRIQELENELKKLNV